MFETVPRSEAPRAGLLPRLWQAPAALSRSSRRLTLTGLFALDGLRHVRETFARAAAGNAVERAGYLSWFAENVLALHGVRVEVRGTVPSGPAIIVANHVSYLDPLTLVSLVPSVAIAKRELASWPVVGEVFRSLGVLFVERQNPYSGAVVLRRAISALRDDVSLLAFPEGTTTAGTDVLPLKRGVFGAARITGCPVIPVAVRYDDPTLAWIGDQTFLPHYVRTTSKAATAVSVSFGRPLQPHDAASPTALAERARTRILELLRG